MKLAVINIATKIGRDNWEESFRLAAKHAPIFGINEAFAPAAKSLYIELAKELGYSQFGTRMGPNPIFWKKSAWKKIEGRQHTLHGRGPNFHIWPGFNEKRFATEVVLKNRRTGREVAIINTHWVPEGRKVPEFWRRRVRAQARRKVISLILHHTRMGRDTYLIGDTNIYMPFKMSRNFTWIRGYGVDKIGIAVPDNRRLVSKEWHPFDAPVDHEVGGIVAKTLVKSRKPK